MPGKQRPKARLCSASQRKASADRRTSLTSIVCAGFLQQYAQKVGEGCIIPHKSVGKKMEKRCCCCQRQSHRPGVCTAL
ncbi:hypothetical protein RvY_03349 [Ramazzottius varieornatus]|uniref:Uncharacterized protein n=1 Tax=Ramazzottius varieornatus TaxID=947166 RepID=A0A1D1UNJ5_RAMVA|nr:hypothetical protein RvY_03349 [Ramazzottius varieornatus]